MGAHENGPDRRASFRQEISTLRFVVPPLLVLALGLVIFELYAPAAMRLGRLLIEVLPAPGEAGPRILLREAAARTISITAAFLYLVTVAFATSVYATIAWQAGSRRLLKLLAFLGVIAAAIGVAISLGSPLVTEDRAASAPGGTRIQQTLSALPRGVLQNFYADQGLEKEFIGLFLPDLMSMVGLVGAIVAFAAACAILGPPRPASAERIEDVALRMRQLRYLLDAASAQLIVGILQIIASLRWPASLVADDALAREAMNLVFSVSVYWGAVYTAIIAALYLPGAFALRRRAERILENLPRERRPADAVQWLREHGLVVSLREQLPQVATMLGPLLAAPLGSWFAGLAG